MKHDFRIISVLLGLFLLAQFLGIGILIHYIDPVATAAQGATQFKDLPIGERPVVQEETSFVPIILVILLGTAILFLLLKYHLTLVWKLWFLSAVTIALITAFTPFIPLLVAVSLALILAAWKIFKPNFYVHTLTELFVYGGLAAIFVPIFTLFSISMLLLLIMIYDAYAVWKSKHMVKLATSQAKEHVFAGLVVPYTFPAWKKEGTPTKVRTALLGGGDIGFPLLFAGVVLKELGLWQSLLIPFFALIGLAFLLFLGKEKKFYPAMPFIGAGCFLGLGVVWLISLILIQN